jgi:linoleoyl-CoA desaturase
MSVVNIGQVEIGQEQANRSISLQKQLRQEVLAVIQKDESQSKVEYQLIKKSMFIFFLWFASYLGFLYIAALNNLTSIILSSLFLGFINTILCCAVFHDASHGVFKSFPRMSEAIAFAVASLFGASSMIWYSKHVKTHHVHTNVFGKDKDIASNEVFRFHEFDKWHRPHKFQHYYALPLYSLLMLKWIFYDDIKSVLVNEHGYQGKWYFLSVGDVLLSRIIHLLVFLIIPALYFNSFYVVLLSYLLVNLVMGVMLSVIFQLAHINPKVLFQIASEAKNTNRLLDQLTSTADFATNNKLITWVTGGLNMQVIHHLFPHLSHTLYPQIQSVVKSFCQKNGLTYNEYSTLFSALKAHLAHLKQFSKSHNHLPPKQV